MGIVTYMVSPCRADDHEQGAEDGEGREVELVRIRKVAEGG